MRSTHIWRSLTAALGLAVLTAAGSQVQAAVVAEWDFQNFDPVDSIVKLSDHKAGTTTDSIVTGGTVHPTAKTGLRDQTVSHGFVSIGSGDNQGLTTPEDGGRWRDFYQAGRQREGMMLVVYRPNFSGVSTVRRSLLQAGNLGGSTQLSLMVHNNGLLTMTSGSSTAASISGFSWDSDTWYVIAGSWKEGNLVSLYIRAIDDLTPGLGDFALSTTASATGAGSGPTNDPLSIGGVSTFTPSRKHGGDGDFAFVQFTDQYLFTEAQFDAVYFTFVPEPISAVMLTGLALAVIRRPLAKR